MLAINEFLTLWCWIKHCVTGSVLKVHLLCQFKIGCLLVLGLPVRYGISTHLLGYTKFLKYQFPNSLFPYLSVFCKWNTLLGKNYKTWERFTNVKKVKKLRDVQLIRYQDHVLIGIVFNVLRKLKHRTNYTFNAHSPPWFSSVE